MSRDLSTRIADVVLARAVHQDRAGSVVTSADRDAADYLHAQNAAADILTLLAELGWAAATPFEYGFTYRSDFEGGRVPFVASCGEASARSVDQQMFVTMRRRSAGYPGRWEPVDEQPTSIPTAEVESENLTRIRAAVAALTPMVTNETHAWNLWNLLASNVAPEVRTALEAAWANQDAALNERRSA